ncbi:hypothetical protein [Sphaerisporangium sp. TRM90804]|uniref:sensor histidine kinase n=1 Tax=Sphaerisporangium sp. TRM90804 TaxID=3031113 RepID=UPI00244A5A96|nr:hypothetical protein [Sphaerisporangium sp. TRM90804]MDH2425826.1 hypothetical protein [Sphaerisporangium sp. TRM90804]
MELPSLLGLGGLAPQILAAAGLAFLGVVVIVAALARRRRHRGAVAASARAEKVSRLERVLLRAQYDYPRPSLAELAQSARKGGLHIRLHVAGAPRELPDPVDLAGMRIVQEALTNVYRHGTPNATVVLSYRPDQLTVTVENALKPKPLTSRGEREGLAMMRRRAGRIGGSVSAGSFPGGWRVYAELPYRSARFADSPRPMRASDF